MAQALIIEKQGFTPITLLPLSGRPASPEKLRLNQRLIPVEYALFFIQFHLELIPIRVDRCGDRHERYKRTS